jgi:hypothetical protein
VMSPRDTSRTKVLRTWPYNALRADVTGGFERIVANLDIENGVRRYRPRMGIRRCTRLTNAFPGTEGTQIRKPVGCTAGSSPDQVARSLIDCLVASESVRVSVSLAVVLIV